MSGSHGLAAPTTWAQRALLWFLGVSAPFANRGPALVGALAAAGIVGYLYPAMPARYLSAPEYAQFLQILSVILISNAAMESMELSVARSLLIRVHANSARDSFRWWRRLFFATSVTAIMLPGLLGAGATALRAVTGAHWHLSPIVVGATGVSTAFTLAVEWGVLRSCEKYRLFGTTKLLSSCLKVLLVLVLAPLPLGVTGPLLAIPLSNIILIVVTLPLALKALKNPEGLLTAASAGSQPAIQPTRTSGFLAPSLLVVSTYVLVQADRLFITSFGSAALAPLYGVVTAVLKVIFYFGQIVAIIALDLSARAGGVRIASRDIHLMATVLCVVPAMAVIGGMMVVGDALVSAFLGTPVAGTREIILLYGPAITLIAIAYSISHVYLGSRRDWAVFGPVIGSAVMLVGMGMFARTLTTALAIVLASGAIALVGSVIFSRLPPRAPRLIATQPYPGRLPDQDEQPRA